MEKIFVVILSIVLIVLINGCSSTTDPQFRIRNEQSDKVNIKIQTSDGNKFDINAIDSGKTTTYQKTSEGNITATDVTHNESVSFPAAKNICYTIVISTGKPLSVLVDK